MLHSGKHPAAAPLHGSHAALRDGRRRQARRGRRTRRGDEGTRPRHAGDARRHHRGPGEPEIHGPQPARADADHQGRTADPVSRGGEGHRHHEPGHDRRVGIPPARDGAWQIFAREIHGRDRQGDEGHRGAREGLRGGRFRCPRDRHHFPDRRKADARNPARLQVRGW